MIGIRRATLDDAPTVARFAEALYAELQGNPSPPPGQGVLARRILAEADRNIGLLAFDGETPVAMLMLTEGHAIYAGGAYGQITELYVLPSLRSRAIATQLVDFARKIGHSRGWRRLEVGAPHQPEWARTLAFYQRTGFVVIGPRLRLDLSLDSKK